MTTPLFLIAHSVRGEAAFDIAMQMECPHCMDGAGTNYGCFNCEDLGYWWIIPTSGHRAFPFDWEPLVPSTIATEVPSGWPDHYRHGPTPTLDIMSLFKAQREAKPHIPRRL